MSLNPGASTPSLRRKASRSCSTVFGESRSVKPRLRAPPLQLVDDPPVRVLNPCTSQGSFSMSDCRTWSFDFGVLDFFEGRVFADGTIPILTCSSMSDWFAGSKPAQLKSHVYF